MGCPCKKKVVEQQTPTPTQVVNQVDEERIAQVKKEIKNIVNKYYTDGKKK